MEGFLRKDYDYDKADQIMAGRFLGIDISDVAITAVQMTSGLKGHYVSDCARVLIGESGGLANAMETLVSRMDVKNDFCIAAIPATNASFRNLQMPFKDRKKIAQTLPFEMETLLPHPIDDVLVDFILINGADQGDVLAVSLKKTDISKYLEGLQNCGIDPDIIDIRGIPVVSLLLRQAGTPNDGLFLELDESSITMVLFQNRRIALIRTFAFDCFPIIQSLTENRDNETAGTQSAKPIEACFRDMGKIVSNTIHSFQWQTRKINPPQKVFFTGVGALHSRTGYLLGQFLDTPAEQINLSGNGGIHMDEGISRIWDPRLMDGALSLALRDAKWVQGLNFRTGDFEAKRRYLGFEKHLKKVGAFLAVIFIFVTADFGVDYYFLKQRYETLDQKVNEVFGRTLPGVKRVGDPVQQMQSEIEKMRISAVSHGGMISGEKMLDLLRDISRRVPKSLNVHVGNLVIDQNSIRINGHTDTFNTVDNVKNSLESSNYFSSVTISSANLDRTGNKVRFEIKLQRKK